jgi:predicted DNA-binding protein YlxM (UPF0122 family)
MIYNYDTEEIKKRIESHIVSKEDCWITDYKIDTNGRPRISLNSKQFILARVVYEVYKEDFSKNLFVCHTCDNPLCINPEHLYLGDNTEKALNQTRRNKQAKGSGISSSKLNEAQVAEIKELLIEEKLSLREIAEKFNVSATAIHFIKHGKSWTHVEGIDKITVKQNISYKRLSEEEVTSIRRLIAEGKSLTEISNLFNVNVSTVSKIKSNKTWNHLAVIDNLNRGSE